MHVAERDGLYYPEHLSIEAIGASQTALLAGAAMLDDLHVWGQAGWKTPHATYDSVTRFTAKALEEHQEFREALDAYLYPNSTDNVEALRNEAISELGDTAFSLTLLALNSSVELEPALRQTLAAYAAETTCIEDGKVVLEGWQEMVQLRLAESSPLTITALDQLIEEGFEPALSTHMVIYRDEYQTSPTPEELAERAMWTIAYLSQATHEAARQFGWGEQYAFAGDMTPSPEACTQIAATIGKMTAQLYLEAAYMAKHALGTTLSTTLQHTVKKISERIAANRVDKADGERTGLMI